MSALIALVLLSLPPLSLSLTSSEFSQTLPHKVNLTSTLLWPLTTRAANRSRRLQSSYYPSQSNTVEFSKFRDNPSNHLTFGRQDADTIYTSPKTADYKPEDAVLNPEVKRYFDGKQDHDTHSDYDNYFGNQEGQYHSSDHNWHQESRPLTYNHPPPQRPVLVAVKTNDDEDAISKLGFLAILKLVLAKFKAFWIIKFVLFILFLVKVPIVLFKIGLKFLLILKFFKLLKLIVIPSLIPLVLLPLLPLFLLLLLPLLLIPLAPLLLTPILLPLLLPLLLLIPAHIIALRPRPVLPAPPPPPPPVQPGPGPEDGRARSSEHLEEELILLVRRVMESERCLERLACDLGGYHTPRTFSGTVTRLLQIIQYFAPKSLQSRLRSYTKAFTFGAENRQDCASKFVCRTPLELKKKLKGTT